ncbi:MAG: hypothetical protein R2883_07545 [Caldisericia bacterium]
MPSLPNPDPEEFRYTSARIKVLETRLLAESDFLRFRNLARENRVAVIEETFVWFDGNPLTFSFQANTHLYEVAQKMAEECGSPDLAYYFQFPRGVEQVQAVLEGATITDALVPVTAKFCETGEISDLPTELVDVVAKAKRLYEFGLIGNARRLMSKTMIELIAASRFSKLPYFKKVLGYWIDTLDVRLLISAGLREGTYRGLPGGNLNLRSDTDLETVGRSLGIHTSDMYEIEKKLDERLFDAIVESRLIPAGPEVVFGYLWELEREFRNAAMLVAGALVAISPEELESAYRRTYAS